MSKHPQGHILICLFPRVVFGVLPNGYTLGEVNDRDHKMTTSTNNVPTLPRNIRQIKKLQQASQRLLVVPRDPERGRYLVQSAGDSGRYYQVAVQRNDLAG